MPSTCGMYMLNTFPQQDPVRTNKIPRQIPEQPWYMNPTFSILVGGILPFGAVFIELFFILTSMWQNQFYYLFGFLCLVFFILIITCAEITIVLCYFQLCSEDYHWWWRSYFTSGSSAVYLFLYSLFYFYTKLEIESIVPMLMYFGYMFMISYSFFCLTGTWEVERNTVSWWSPRPQQERLGLWRATCLCARFTARSRLVRLCVLSRKLQQPVPPHRLMSWQARGGKISVCV